MDDPRRTTDHVAAPITATIDQLASEVAQLQDRLSMLHDRLRPVLSPLEQADGGGDEDCAAREPNSPTTELLTGLVDVVLVADYTSDHDEFLMRHAEHEGIHRSGPLP